MNDNFEHPENSGLNTPMSNPYQQSNQTSSFSLPQYNQDTSPYTAPSYTPNDFSATNTKKKSGKKWGLSIAAICAALVISGGSFYAGVSYFDNSTSNGTQGLGNSVVANASTLNVSSNDTEVTSTITQVVDNAMPSMVAISTVSEEQVNDMYGYFYRYFMGEDFDNTYQVSASGSGIIISQNADELLIVTNNHVIEGANEITVEFFDSQSYTATVKGTSASNDLAVISVPLSSISADTLKSIKVATVGSSDTLKLGEPAIAIGNALGYGQSVTVGYISAKERTVQLSDSTMTLLQTDAAINPGNSGGALLNIKGEVIGINSAKYSDTSVEGTGYAIPISDAMPIIENLMSDNQVAEEDKPYLGIAGDSVPASYRERFGWPEGVYVAQIMEDSPAELAGMSTGDIVTAVNGTSVKSMEDIQLILENCKAGDQIKITVSRSSRTKMETVELTATLVSRKDAGVVD